jgi:hypothetical protein
MWADMLAQALRPIGIDAAVRPAAASGHTETASQG